MISCPSVEKRSISSHYNVSTLFYRLFWGPHIHHGLWERDETPRQAQLRLTERLSSLAGIRTGDRVLDVGCGMGGSSIHLAKAVGCQVTGVTLSPFQRRWAALSAAWHGVGRQTEFLCGDAEAIPFSPGRFDVIWSIECTEHLFDKAHFFRRAATWLKPAGRIAICAWLAGEEPLNPVQRQQALDVCEGFLCPSLGTMRNYVEWFQNAGLTIEQTTNWTEQVARTWLICKQRVDHAPVKWLAKLLGQDMVLFLDRFQTIFDAYQSGAMQYGCLVARRPAAAA